MLGGAGFRPPTVVLTFLNYKHFFHVPNGEKVTIFNGFGDYITGVVGGNLKSPKASEGVLRIPSQQILGFIGQHST